MQLSRIKFFEVDGSQITLQNKHAADVLRGIVSKVYSDTDFVQPAPVSSEQQKKKKKFLFF